MRKYAAGIGWLTILRLMLVACKADPFAGTWKPAPMGDSERVHVEALDINKDGTFSFKLKDSSRKAMTGNYVKSGNKTTLSNPDIKQTVEATIESDGRLSLSENGRKPIYFSKS